MLIDTHCHLSSSKFSGDIEEVISRANGQGVRKIILPATNVEDTRSIVKLVNKHEGLYGLAGIYPGEIQKNDNKERDLIELRKIIQEEEKIIGVGEIGIDCYWAERDVEIEKLMFREQLVMAAELGVPVAIHNRKAEVEIKEVFEDIENLPSGHFHCWSGSAEFLKYVLERGFYVGICGNIMYPSNNELREIVKNIPIDKLLIETDSPYLPPQGKRGERNEPQNVKIIAEFLAKLLNLKPNSFIKRSESNTKRLYKI